jgi:uncharacterized protein YbjT (DUF2867 family)
METTEEQAPRGRIVGIVGSTGLVGHLLLEELLEDPGIARVHAFGRRIPERRDPRLTAHEVDFAELPNLPPLDEALIALGTTRKDAGSSEAFREVDYGMNLAFARAAVAAGARRIGLVSAMGADSRSHIFYNHVKGELEEALQALPLEALVIARPSLLLGDRTLLGQNARPLERGLHAVSPLLAVLPPDLCPIPAAAVAKALARRLPRARGLEVLPSGKLRAAARE